MFDAVAVVCMLGCVFHDLLFLKDRSFVQVKHCVITLSCSTQKANQSHLLLTLAHIPTLKVSSSNKRERLLIIKMLSVLLLHASKTEATLT